MLLDKLVFMSSLVRMRRTSDANLNFSESGELISLAVTKVVCRNKQTHPARLDLFDV